MRPISLSLLFLLMVFTGVPAHAGSKPPPQVTLRVYIQTAGEGLPGSQAISVPLPPNGEIIQVRAFPEVTEHDIFGVKTDAQGHIFLTLNHRGKINLETTTGADQGRIMVVMLNGFVIYAPIIDEQISSGVLEIPHPLPPEVIKVLQDIAKDNVRSAPPAPQLIGN